MTRVAQRETPAKRPFVGWRKNTDFKRNDQRTCLHTCKANETVFVCIMFAGRSTGAKSLVRTKQIHGSVYDNTPGIWKPRWHARLFEDLSKSLHPFNCYLLPYHIPGGRLFLHMSQGRSVFVGTV